MTRYVQGIVAAANKLLAGEAPDPTPSVVTVTKEFIEAQAVSYTHLRAHET